MQATYSIGRISSDNDVTVAAELISTEKKEIEEVRRFFAERGRSATEIERILKKVFDDIEEAKQEIRYHDRLYGGAICIVGLLVTVLTFHFAEPSFKYAVAYLAVIYGVFRFIRGCGLLS